ncbi:MAG: lysophospholipid acyltransferase family protein [Actinomycetes bacterium]
MTHRRIGFWYRLAAILLRRPLMLLTRRDWAGAEHLGTGGIVVVSNHVSHFDPLPFAHFLYDNGRLPRFLAKAGLFDVFFVGSVLRGAKQIPVYRESSDAQKAYSAAVAAVQRGECVAIYPEATLTRDPDLWPMRGKTGAARVALATGAPVVPIAQWGPQHVLPPYAKRAHVFPRRTMHVRAGAPVDLSEFMGRPVDAELLQAVTEKIMAAITSLLEEVRGEKAPAVRFDPRVEGLPATGNPARAARPDPEGRRSA